MQEVIVSFGWAMELWISFTVFGSGKLMMSIFWIFSGRVKTGGELAFYFIYWFPSLRILCLIPILIWKVPPIHEPPEITILIKYKFNCQSIKFSVQPFSAFNIYHTFIIHNFYDVFDLKFDPSKLWYWFSLYTIISWISI